MPLSPSLFITSAALAVAARAARPGRLSILIYHRVLPQPDPLLRGDPDIEAFDWQMKLLAKHFNVLPLEEANQRRAAGTLPPRAVAITFDDGYADNAEIALPVLEKHGLTATFFIASEFLNGGRMWNDTVIETLRRLPAELPEAKAKALWSLLDSNGEVFNPGPLKTMTDKVNALPGILTRFKYLPLAERLEQVNRFAELAAVDLPNNLMMTTAQLKKLADAGMEIGGHTVNHPILATLDASEAASEIKQNKQWLENTLKKPVTAFAYPNGRPNQDYNAKNVNAVRELGFNVAVSTAVGVSRRDSDAQQLPRFTPWDRTPERFLLRLVKNTYSRHYDQVAA